MYGLFRFVSVQLVANSTADDLALSLSLRVASFLIDFFSIFSNFAKISTLTTLFITSFHANGTFFLDFFFVLFHFVFVYLFYTDTFLASRHNHESLRPMHVNIYIICVVFNVVCLCGYHANNVHSIGGS